MTDNFVGPKTERLLGVVISWIFRSSCGPSLCICLCFWLQVCKPGWRRGCCLCLCLCFWLHMCASGGWCPCRVTTSSPAAALFLMAVTNLLSSYNGMNAIAISTHGQNIFFLCADMLVSLSRVDENSTHRTKHCQRHYGPRRWLLWPVILVW